MIDLVEYIKQRLKNGYSIERIKSDLITLGYNEAQINTAISSFRGVKESLVDYVRKQSANYPIETIRGFLIQQGYDASIVSNAINEATKASEIKVKHEIHLSKTTVLVVMIVFIGIVILVSSIFFLKPEAKSSIKPLEQLDVSTELITKQAIPGENLKFKISISNFGSSRGFDVEVKYEILKGDKQINFKTESRYLETSFSDIKEIQIPEDALPGKYVLLVTASYSNYYATSRQVFTVNAGAENAEEPIEIVEETVQETEMPAEENKTTEEPIAESPVLMSSYKEHVKSITDINQLGAVCEQTTETDNRNFCFIELSIKTKNTENCKYVDESSRDRCIRAVALATENIGLCADIQTEVSRELCTIIINTSAKLKEQGVSYTINPYESKLDFNMDEAMEKLS